MSDTVFVTGLVAARLSRRDAARGRSRPDLQARPDAGPRPYRSLAQRPSRAYRRLRSGGRRHERSVLRPTLPAGRGRGRRGGAGCAGAVFASAQCSRHRTQAACADCRDLRRCRRLYPARRVKNPAMAEALLALGGNVGDVRATLDRAIDALCDGTDIRLVARSSDYLTPPWGIADQPAFVNICIAVETVLAPQALLARAQTVERACGRDRAQEQRWGPRPLDIDVLAYDDVVLDTPESDSAASAAPRARLRAGAARRNRARAVHLRHGRPRGPGACRQRRHCPVAAAPELMRRLARGLQRNRRGGIL